MKERTAQLLQDARKAACTEDTTLLLAGALLETSSGAFALVLYAPEYGDGVGLDWIAEFITKVRQFGLLKPGETIDRYVLCIEPKRTEWEHMPIVSPQRREPRRPEDDS